MFGAESVSNLQTLGLLSRQASEPTACALRNVDGPAISWDECAQSVLSLASKIGGLDLGPNRRVLVIARNRPSTVIAHAATVLAQACSVPVSFHLTAGEIAYIASQSGARFAFVDSYTLDTVRAAIAEANLDLELFTLPDEGAIAPDLEPLTLSLEQSVLPSLLFTSGTTGRPKAVQLPPKTVGSSADLGGFIDHISSHRLAKHGTHLVVGPMYHNGPLTAVRLLLCGVPIVVMDRFDAQKMLNAISEYAVESSIMVPTHFSRALGVAPEERDAIVVSSLKQVVHTGGRCPIDVKRAMIDWWGPILAESYGGTESGSVCSIGSADWLAHPGSVGKAVAPFESLVVDDAGDEVAPNTEGRLYFRDTTGRGIVYEGDPAKTAEAHLSPGVFTLGEIGYVDEDGFVFITDRFSDMVVSGGVNIYPAESEQVLTQHADVVDAACIGVPDDEMGERLVALVQISSGSALSDGDLRAWCRESLASYKCPKEFRQVSTIPRNPMGKIDKKTLAKSITSPE